MFLCSNQLTTIKGFNVILTKILIFRDVPDPYGFVPSPQFKRAGVRKRESILSRK